ncbi:sensor histidine kinase [Cecembia rubra]|uniref:Oxygen sensor histidine kinase NreB n=1 Tax=Cecembia rubra TaxID=1485585 RepID=A0A2P8ED99_9BACT|nr:7TM diverse intracellular signaling domain-containing protein [Cecembia rubra]PSL07455.1 signal transduction histidine kinase [Cecembia rubra]
MLKNFKEFLTLIFLAYFFLSCNSTYDDSLTYKSIPYHGENANFIWQAMDSLPQSSGPINKGISPTPWWIYTEFENNSNTEVNYYLTLKNPHINLLKVYFDNNDYPELILGDRHPFYERPIINRDLIVPLKIDPGQKLEILLLVDKSGETNILQPSIMSELEFVNNTILENLLLGFILGWMIIILIFAVFTAFQLKESGALFYALFIISIMLWYISHWGLGFQFLWPESIGWAGKSRPFFNLMTNMFFLILVLRFFPPQNKKSILVWSIWILIAIHLLLIWETLSINELELPVQDKIFFLKLTFGLSILLVFLVLAYLIRQIQNKVPYAGYYLAGISIMVLFSIFTQLNHYGVYFGTSSFIFDFGGAFSLLGETIFITAAFASRTADFKREKEKLGLQIIQKEKELADQLIQVQEEERTRIGRDLHDSLGGQLASIYILADRLSQDIDQAQNLDKLKSLVKESIKESRALSHDLAPSHLNELGLETILKNRLRFIEENHAIKTNFYYKIKTPIPSNLALMVYRICSELLQNVLKHAQAKEIMLQIIQKGNILELIVEDDGIGIDLENKHRGIGISNIKNRVAYLKGQFNLDSNPNGTTIIIQLPVESN